MNIETVFGSLFSISPIALFPFPFWSQAAVELTVQLKLMAIFLLTLLSSGVIGMPVWVFCCLFGWLWGGKTLVM